MVRLTDDLVCGKAESIPPLARSLRFFGLVVVPPSEGATDARAELEPEAPAEEELEFEGLREDKERDDEEAETGIVTAAAAAV